MFISCIGLIYKRKGVGIAFFALGISGTALLMPALSIPDGIPSPAATMAQFAPWQDVAEVADGNPQLRDVTYQVQPWLIFLRSEMRQGRLPFWDPHQFSGSPFWSNGSSAPLFPLHLLFAALPLQFAFIILPWLRFVIGGLGVWFLARELGLGTRGSLVSCLIYPLSGLCVAWILVPMSNAFALAPWVLWSVERIANGKSGWLMLSVTAGLSLLSGHPETVIHTAMISGLYLLVRGSRDIRRSWSGFLIGWIVAGMLSAVVNLPFLFTLLESSKWLYKGTGGSAALDWISVLAQPLRIVLPDMTGNPALGTWWGPFNYIGTTVYAGALTILLAFAGLSDFWKDRRWLALSAILVFSFLAVYILPLGSDLVKEIPIFGKMVHHRLRFAIGLSLALLAGFGFNRWLEGEGKTLLIGTATVALLLVAAWLGLGGLWKERGYIDTQLYWTLWVLGSAIIFSFSLFLSPDYRKHIWLAVPVILVVDLLAAHGRINPGLSLGKLYPVTPAVEFLKDKPGRIAGTGGSLHPDAAMVYGLYDVRGDNVVKLERYERAYSSLSAEYDPVYFRPIADWNSPMIRELGVRWILTPPGHAPPIMGLAQAYNGRDASIYEMKDAMPIVRWLGARDTEEDIETGLVVQERRPGYWRISWETSTAETIVVAETWDRGWKARLSPGPGEWFSPDAVDGILMGVSVGPGPGQLELRYIPYGLIPGAIVSLSGLTLLVVFSFVSYGRQKRNNRRAD